MFRPTLLAATIIGPLLSVPAYGDSFERPIPLAQTATAELWFAFASLLFCAALYLVYRAVSKR